jgi:xanthine dioxygenase
MTIETQPLTLPPSADPSKFSNFGRQVIGVDPGNLSPAEFSEIEQLLYKVDLYERERERTFLLIFFLPHAV